MNPTWTALVIVAAGAGLGGCAAAPMRAAESPSAPAPAVVASPPPPPPAAIAADAAPSSLVGGRDAREGAPPAARALLEMVTAERELAASTGNCRSACKALGAMDRSAGRLCGLASSPPEQRACDESKAKVIMSRADVAASCGTCVGGPSLDPHAPVPSQ